MTEVYVSLDNEQFNKLDLDEVESIVIKYIAKDLQDISKVFLPFSQTFSFKATPSNQRSLLFFGNTTLLRPPTKSKYYCKVYINGLLALTGKIQVKEGRYEDMVLKTYNADFGTFMENLKEIIGEDKLTSLGSCVVDWKASDVIARMQSVLNAIAIENAVTNSTTSLKYYCPFMSTNRVWQFYPRDVAGAGTSNIKWYASNNVEFDSFISGNEVRPSVSLLGIIDLIKKRYDLDILSPIEQRAEVKDAYIWCNNEKFQNTEYYPMKFKTNTVNLDTNRLFNEAEWTGLVQPKPKYLMEANSATNTIKITKRTIASGGYENHCEFWIDKQSYVFPGDTQPNGRFRLIRTSNQEILYSSDFTTTDLFIRLRINIPDSMFNANNVCEFVMEFSYNDYTKHKNLTFTLYQYYRKVFGSGQCFGPIYQRNSSAWVDSQYGTFNEMKIDLIKMLPDTPIIDFLTSYLKTFNVKVFDTAPDNDKLFWLTPKDINTTGQEYSKSTLNYTPYLDPKSFSKKLIDDYNYYNFRHQESKYRSNVDYAKATNGIQYGQLTYPLEKPKSVKEYKVETKWSIIPPVFVVGTPDIITTYGFSSDEPTYVDGFSWRYTPVWDELTIMYLRDPIQLTEPVAFRSCDANGVPFIYSLDQYCTAFIANNEATSLGFSILVFNNIQYTKNMYQLGYSTEIKRLLDENVLKHEFTFNLPSNEIYLNETQGGTPQGFRLQNDIIVGETLFSILDFNIDIIKGKCTGTLINY